MTQYRFYVRIVFLVLVASMHHVGAEELPTFKVFQAPVAPQSRLRIEPKMLSRFPTTFSAALAGKGAKLRTVDIDGRVWERYLGGENEPSLLTQTNRELACAILSEDGRWLAFAEPNGSVGLMDLGKTEIVFRDTTSKVRTVSLRFSPDSQRFAGVAVDGNVRVWDLSQGNAVQTLTAEQSPVQTIAFSPTGKQLAIASFSQEVTLHDVVDVGPAGRPSTPRVFHLETSRVTALAFSPDGQQLVIAAADGTASIRSLVNDHQPIVLGSHPFAVWSVSFDPGGQRMATGSWDGTIKVWDAKSWVELQSLKQHEESVAMLVFDRQRGLISAGLDGRLLHWVSDVQNIGSTAMIDGRADSVWVTAYSPNGKKLFVGGKNERFELWDVESKSLVVSRAGHPTTRCATFSPDGQTLATGGDDGKIELRDSESGKSRGIRLTHPGAVSAVVYTADGQKIVSACDGGVVKVWDAATGAEISTWQEHKQQIYCANISPDGKWLITGGGNWTTGDPGELIVWELETGLVRGRVEGHKLAVWTIVFTPDGKRFATCDSSGAVKIWNLETLEAVTTLQHTTWVRPLAISPDGGTLAVGRGDGSVRLWDTTTWTQRASCGGHASFTFWLQFAPGGNTLVSSGEDGTVRFWQMDR